ncbi:hypothetical protein L218DRAFT_997542 [Marasmius fiardii PR-910]|nr:hypothetical protein L218DRAFT_997542 [Marasmius fiardii PR-910]
MQPYKRRKVEDSEEDIEEIEGTYIQAILPEISVEIGLRQRLAETIESRIAWALLLQETLTNDTSSNSEISFRDTAFEALDAIESRNRILYPSDATTPVIPITSSTTKPRPPPKEKPLTRSQKAKFLYLRSNDRVFILRCPACLRHSFSSLQGLYNHSRLSHNVEWGSHEECVKACAVLQQDFDQILDLEAGIEVGSTSQIGGILPGVRSLFQMAVDGSYVEPSSALDGGDGDREDSGLHLTRTLGWHSETPALAQFLGKEMIRKGIKVWNEDQDVDVDGLNETAQQGLKPARRRWRMPYLHRSRVTESEVVDSVGGKAFSALQSHQEPNVGKSDTIAIHSHHESSSRFHITCRITVADHSLFIPEECRSSGDTHKWMMTVESASYSLDLTSVLTDLTVSPLSDTTGMAAPNMFSALSVKEPPFLVVGTTSEPFLAKVELKFTPSVTRPEGQTVILEHWVGLDMLGTAGSCKGDEQVVDVELDKDTHILPTKTGYLPVTSKLHWDKMEGSSGSNQEVGASGEQKQKESEVEGTLSYQEILKSILPKFPMTMKDAAPASNPRTKATPRVPYKLVSDGVQLQGLVIGRRKAIEWARAKAIRDAYTDKINELQESSDNQQCIPLTVGDVYCWLEDEGHFFRDKLPEEPVDSAKGKQAKGKGRDVIEEDKWCRRCGLGVSLHLYSGAFGAPSGSDTNPPNTATASAGPSIDGESHGRLQEDFQCTIVQRPNWKFRFPMLNVMKVIQVPLQQSTTSGTSASTAPPSDLLQAECSTQSTELVEARRNRLIVSACDPVMTRFVLSHSITSDLPASHIIPLVQSESVRQFPIHQFGMTPTLVDATLAPHAYLALATKQFVRALIGAALEVSKRDKDSAITLHTHTQIKHPQGQDRYPNHLTPVIFMQSGSTTSSGSRKKSAGLGGGRKKEKEGRIHNLKKVLTPMHVFGAVRAAASSNASPSRLALCTCLSRLGVALDASESGTTVMETPAKGSSSNTHG